MATNIAKDNAASEAIIKGICHRYIAAMNNRTLEPTDEIWTKTCTSDCKLYAASSAMFSNPNSDDWTGAEYQVLNIESMCKMWKEYAALHPEWRSRVVDILVSFHPSVGTAEAWCSAEHSGVDGGVTKMALWVGYFGIIEGEWKLTKARTVAGMGSHDGF